MTQLHLAAALNGAGWHPAAGAAPALSACYWSDLVATAERGLLDMVTFEDPPNSVDARGGRSRLDALSIAALTAPLTSRIGLVPAVTTTYTEPFHTAAALAVLDDDSAGRAGWRVRTSLTPADLAPGDVPAAPWGTSAAAALVADVLEQAADAVAQVRALTDPWSTAATACSSPDGPLVVSLGYGWDSFRLAARSADVVLTTPHDAFGAAMLDKHVRAAERDVGRAGPPLRILADLTVLLDDTVDAARARLDRLDASRRLETDAAVVATTASGLADLMLAWAPAGIDGYRLRPARLPADLGRITDELVPELQRRGAFRTTYDEHTLRARFGLGRRAGAVAS